jgi:hypothetical protein
LVTKHAFCSRGDELQRSLELLDSVLSEFDDLENGNGGEAEGGAPAEAPSHVSSTPEDESPSLGGHQSEDDGYMSMNGRRAKFVLSFRPVPDEGQPLELPPAPDPPPDPPPTEMADFPPPPEEAERIISTLLPRYVCVVTMEIPNWSCPKTDLPTFCVFLRIADLYVDSDV